MQKRVALALVPLVACWSSANKDLDRKVDALASEVANNRAQVEKLDRKLSGFEVEQNRETALQAKIEELEKKLAVLTAPPPPPTMSPPPPPRRFGPDPAKTFSVPLGAAYIDGPATAKVTMIIADEYACPYCEKVRPTLVDLRKKYGKDLRIAYRQYVVHPQQATAPALAICAATKQRKHDKLDPLLWEAYRQRQFDSPQKDLTNTPCWDTPDGCAIVVGLAKQAGLDVARFKRDMQGACVTELADSTRELTALGIGATPSFFVNGRFTSGAQPIESFATLIDEELAKANERIQRGAKQASYYQDWVIDRGDKPPAP